MPAIFRQDGFRFFFYSNEGDPREPIHVHVMRDRTVEDRRGEIERAWHDHFG